METKINPKNSVVNEVYYLPEKCWRARTLCRETTQELEKVKRVICFLFQHRFTIPFFDFSTLLWLVVSGLDTHHCCICRVGLAISHKWLLPNQTQKKKRWFLPKTARKVYNEEKKWNKRQLSYDKLISCGSTSGLEQITKNQFIYEMACEKFPV